MLSLTARATHLLAYALVATALTACSTATSTIPVNEPSAARFANPDPAALSAAPMPNLPVTVTSFDGVDVTITDASRIIAVDQYGTLGETVFALGLGENLVGRDTSTNFPAAEHIPNVTPGGHSLNAEAILDLNPTVILTDTTVGPRAVQRQLRDAGIPVVFFDPARTLDGVSDQIRSVATVLGVNAAGEELADRITGEIEEAQAEIPVTDPPLRIAFLYLRGTGTQLIAGPGSGADELITAVGAECAGTAAGLANPFTPITSEALIAARPDVLILMQSGLDSVGGVDGLLTIPGIKQTPAGRDARIVTLDETGMLSFGPRTPDTISAVAAATYNL